MSRGPCIKCGESGVEIVIERDDEMVASNFMCDGCFGAAMEDFAVKRRQFEMLLANGVSRKRANEIMIERMEHKP